MQHEERIEALITPSLEAMGYEVVRVMIQGKQRPTLQIMAERCDRVPMTVEDCAEISRSLSALLDVEDPIQGQYTLEVSSPGIDRPLTRPGDFDRFAGFEARIELSIAVDGRKRFKGRLLGRDEAGDALMDVDGERLALPLSAIHRAKLVLTDELIAAAMQEQDAHQEQED